MPEELMTEPKTETDEEPTTTSEQSFWSPLIIVTSIYCIVTFLLTALATSQRAPWIMAIPISSVFAQTQLASIFAALGSGSYWKRLAITQIAFACVYFAFVGGNFVAMGGQPVSPGGKQNLISMMFITSIASQMVYGFFRIVRGWRLHTLSIPRGPVYVLSDLFAVTLFLAAALAALTANFPGNADDKAELAFGFVLLGVAVALATLFYGVPTIMTTFKVKEHEEGCFAQMIIVVSIGFLIIMPFAAMGAGIVFIPVVAFLVGCSVFTWIPLSMMRQNGFVLTRGKDKRSDQE